MGDAGLGVAALLKAGFTSKVFLPQIMVYFLPKYAAWSSLCAG